jgi:hypothetical protein
VIKVPPQVEISRLECPLPLRSDLKRTAEGAEVTRLLQLGVSSHNTNGEHKFVFVDITTNDKDGNPDGRRAADLRKVSEVTEPD